MRDLGSTYDVVDVIPQDEALNLDIKFYFSKVSSIREEALENPKSASNKFTTLIVISFYLCHVFPYNYSVDRETAKCAKGLPGLFYIHSMWIIGTCRRGV
jgi:hypothetical protein